MCETRENGLRNRRNSFKILHFVVTLNFGCLAVFPTSATYITDRREKAAQQKKQCLRHHLGANKYRSLP